MDPNSIFISQNENNIDNDIAGKLTYTNIIETIPDNKIETQLTNWKKKYKTEWRWRFLFLKNKDVIEISYLKNNSNKRIYFNRYGQWVERTIDPIFDLFVKKKYYFYTND